MPQIWTYIVIIPLLVYFPLSVNSYSVSTNIGVAPSIKNGVVPYSTFTNISAAPNTSIVPISIKMW